MTKFKHNVEQYLFSRDHFRKIAQTNFLKSNPNAHDLVVFTNELVASLTLFASGKDLRDIKNGLYIGDLIVSFCRSHFISSDLILNGELIEAASILRKQMELIARLNEFRAEVDIEKLVKKTPNVKHLKTNIKKTYSAYSEIAHSASPRVMSLLGRSEHEVGNFTPLYPVFDKNSYIALQHFVVVAFEFYVWCGEFYIENFKGYDSTLNSLVFEKAFEKYEEMYTED